MRIKRLKINYNGKEKNLALIGEIHYYNRRESESAENLLNSESFDVIFLEGSEEYMGKIGYAAGRLMKLFYRTTTFIIGRNYPTLIDFARKRKIPVKYLEEGTTLPLTTQLGLLLLFGIPITFIIRTALQNPAALLLYVPVLLTAFLLGTLMWRNPYIGRKLGKFIPVNIEKRDEIMCKKLISYIKETEFKNAIVVVGLFHLDSIVSCLKKDRELKF